MVQDTTVEEFKALKAQVEQECCTVMKGLAQSLRDIESQVAAIDLPGKLSNDTIDCEAASNVVAMLEAQPLSSYQRAWVTNEDAEPLIKAIADALAGQASSKSAREMSAIAADQTVEKLSQRASIPLMCLMM